MGKILSRLSRPLQNYNIESRTYNFLDKDKRPAAPRHPSTIKKMEELAKQDPKIFEAPFDAYNDEMNERLKHVFVVSESSKASTEPDKIQRALPKDRRLVEDTFLGFREPDTIREGQITLRQAIEMLTRRQSEPERWTMEILAKEYKIDEPILQKVLLHFATFNLYIPPSKDRDTPVVIRPDPKNLLKDKIAHHELVRKEPELQSPQQENQGKPEDQQK